MLVCTFNQEKALVGGFSVIVKSSRIFVWSSRGDAVWGSCDTNHTTFYKHSTDHPRKCPSWPDICCAAAIIVVYWASRRQWCWCLGPAPATLSHHPSHPPSVDTITACLGIKRCLQLSSVPDRMQKNQSFSFMLFLLLISIQECRGGRHSVQSRDGYKLMRRFW